MLLEDPPDEPIEMIRYVTLEEQPYAIQECMADYGFTINVDGPGAYNAEYPSDQRDAYRLAKYTCVARYPLHHVYWTTHSEETLRLIYDYSIAETIPCLAEHGIIIDDIPTWETYRAEYETLGGILWIPERDHESTGCSSNPPGDQMIATTD